MSAHFPSPAKARGFVASPREMRVDFRKRYTHRNGEASSSSDTKEKTNIPDNKIVKFRADDDDDDLLVREDQLSRVLVVALAGAVAWGSFRWTLALGLSMYCTDSRLRDRLEKWHRLITLCIFLEEEDQGVFRDDDEREEPLVDMTSSDAEEVAVIESHRSVVHPQPLVRRSRQISPDHPLAKYCGRWSYDPLRSDSPMQQLEALGVPWAARVAASRSARHMQKRIHLDGPFTWVEATHTAILARSSQTLCLTPEDNVSGQTHTHPVDRSTVVVWSAVGRRPDAAPQPELQAVAVPTNIPDAVVSVMLYKRNGALATIIRTCEDHGRTYHVINDLATPSIPQRPDSLRKHVVTHSFFKRLQPSTT